MIRRGNIGLKKFGPLLALSCMVSPSMAAAQSKPVSLRDSFSIGNSQGTLCQVQDRSIENKAKQSMFDRSWAIVCRDSARPVGNIYAFRSPETDPLTSIAAQRDEAVSCKAVEATDTVRGFNRTACTLADEPVAYSIFQEQSGNVTYVAEGLTAYDDATLLALRSILTDNIVEGKIEVASTSIEDPFAFARVQAATLKPDQALAEGYRRNLSGNYAEAAAFFETLQQRTSELEEKDQNPEEYLVNRALQKSNLGEFAEADNLFERAKAIDTGDTITQKLLRNFEAIHLMNQGNFDEAIARVNIPVKAVVEERDSLRKNLTISRPISSRLNGGDRTANLLGFADDLKLTDEERGEIIDAQGLQLIGTAERVKGNVDTAENALANAYSRVVAVRDGRVTSITRLRTQILSELALVAEDRGDFGGAEGLLRKGIEILEVEYPETRSVNSAKAKLAAFLLRRGREDEARTIYRAVVDNSLGKRSAVSGLANNLAPYFRLLTKDSGSADEFFKASQILVRPGVAETQAILSRELSGGTDEAARLFRQSTNLARSIERLRIRFSSLGRAEQASEVRAERDQLGAEIEELERSQQVTLVRLSEYPQFKAIASSSITLEDLRANMTATEAYARMAIIGGDVFMFYADKDYAAAYNTDLRDSDLDEQVDNLRASISTLENGQYVTYPFDIEVARSLYTSLFGKISDRLAGKSHLIFEPDGAMLRLPINLLVTDDASVAKYLAQADAPDGDPFDYTGVKWLGTDTNISTAVSARGFSDARQAPASTATQQYLGMGRNKSVFGVTNISGVRGMSGDNADSCEWPLSEWNKPISDAELNQASQLIGLGSSQVLTEAEFTDDRILAKKDIADYRIIHFATHGLVTAPKPSCPAKPALLTSFGEGKSDGLLAFDEIFDLKLDADIVILSACDTAGKASIRATREAGVSSGGGTALDGLVRSFIGAGSRSVLASHWPAPDDFKATERLIGGLFSDGKGQSVATALRISQKRLMDDPVTSHPYYWSGFAIIGDGERPFLPADKNAAIVNSAFNEKGSALK